MYSNTTKHIDTDEISIKDKHKPDTYQALNLAVDRQLVDNLADLFEEVGAFERADDDGLTLTYEDLNVRVPELEGRSTKHDTFADFAIASPDTFLFFAETTLRAVLDSRDAKVRLGGEWPTHTSIEELSSADVGQLVSLDARVTDATEVYPEFRRAVFKCRACSATMPVKQNWKKKDNLDYPHECKNRDCSRSANRNWEHLKRRAVAVDKRQAILQDPHEVSSRNEPAEMVSELDSNLVRDVDPGDDIRVAAVVRTYDDHERRQTLFLHVVGIEHADSDFDSLSLSDEERERIREIASRDDVHDHIVDSIAPSEVKSYREDTRLAKRAVAYQLFGGVSTADKRGDSHLLMVGDPSTGKTRLAEWASSVAPTSEFVSAENTTKVGLTAAVTYDDRLSGGDDTATVSGGVVVRAHGGLAVVDELDKASAEHQTSLHEPMSRQTVSLSKGNVSATLPAESSVLAVANPKEQRFQDSQPIAAQIGVNDTIWSRFDLVVILRDEPDEETDKELAREILDEHAGDSGENYIPKDLLRKYVAEARRIDPVPTTDARDLIAQKYAEIRGKSTDGRVTLSTRQLEGILRLAEASARMRLDDELTVEDASRAIDLVLTTLRQVGVDDRGRLDIDVIESGMSASQRERHQTFWNAYDDLEESGSVDRGSLRGRVTADDTGVSVRQFESMLDKFEERGDLHEPEDGVLVDVR